METVTEERQAPALPPPLTLTIVISALFGPFGAIPAAIHSERAASLGASKARYWKAFGITWAISTAVVVAVSILVNVLLLGGLVAAARFAPAPGTGATGPAPAGSAAAGSLPPWQFGARDANDPRFLLPTLSHEPGLNPLKDGDLPGWTYIAHPFGPGPTNPSGAQEIGGWGCSKDLYAKLLPEPNPVQYAMFEQMDPRTGRFVAIVELLTHIETQDPHATFTAAVDARNACTHDTFGSPRQTTYEMDIRQQDLGHFGDESWTGTADSTTPQVPGHNALALVRSGSYILSVSAPDPQTLSTAVNAAIADLQHG